MELPNIQPLPPSYGIRGIGGERRQRQGAFEQAWQEQQKRSEAEGEAPAPSEAPATAGRADPLQETPSTIRRMGTDGLEHVDVLA